MKYGAIIFLVLLFCLKSLTQEEVRANLTAEETRRAKLLAEQQASRNVIVEIELEPVPDIKKYEIEILNLKEKKPQSFVQTEPNFSVPLMVGRYKFRSRMSSREEISPWSDWFALEAQPDASRFVNLTEKYVISKKEKSALVNLNWEYANGAKSYRLWFEKIAETSKIKKIETIANTFSAKLPPGRYRIGIQSVANGGIVSEVRYHENPIEVIFASLPKIKVKSGDLGVYSWEKLEDSQVKVAIFYKPFFGQDFKLMSEALVPLENWQFPKDARPGEYRLQFHYVSDELQNGEMETVFLVKRPGQKEFDESRAD